MTIELQQQNSDNNNIHDAIKNGLLKLRRMRRWLNSPQNLDILFKDWYLPIEHQEVFLEKAREEPKFLRKLVNASTTFIQSVEERIRHNSNMIILIAGQPGTGKSIIGLAIMKIIKEVRKRVMLEEAQKTQTKINKLLRRKTEFKKAGKLKQFNRTLHKLRDKFHYQKERSKCKLHLAFNGTQLIDKINTVMGDGDIIQTDEWEQLIGEGAKNELAKLSNILATMRFTGKCVILCTPMNAWLTGMTARFVPFGQYNRFFDTGKPEDMMSRCLWYVTPIDATSNKEEYLMGYIVFRLDRISQLEQSYQQKKENNYRELESKGGAVGASTDIKTKRLKEIAQLLYNWSHEKRGYPEDSTNPAKVILDTYIRESGIGKELDLADRRDLKVYVVRLAKYGTLDEISPEEQTIEKFIPHQNIEDIQEQLDTSQPFTVDINIVYARILKENRFRDPEKAIEIYDLAVEKHTKNADIQTITDENGQQKYPLSDAALNYYIEKVGGAVNRIKGLMYEEFYFTKLHKKYGDRVIHNGGQSQPDIILYSTHGTPTFISVKCIYLKTYLKFNYEKSKAEINAARKYYKETKRVPTVEVHVYNTYNQKIYTRYIPPTLITSEQRRRGKYVGSHLLRVNEFDKDDIH